MKDPADAAAWAAFADRYGPLMKNWFRAARVQPADADDLAQRAFAVVLSRVGGFRPSGRPGAFRAWLRRIAVNLLREFWRARLPLGPAEDAAHLPDPGVDPDRAWDADHDRHVLGELLAAVRPEFAAATWAAFTRVVLDGVPPRAAAAELGLTPNAVFIAKSRVLARLRREAGAARRNNR